MPRPVNEPPRTYAPGSPERTELEGRLAAMSAQAPVQIDGLFGDERRPGSGADRLEVTMPSDHAHVLGGVQQA